MKLATGIVLYNPDIERLKENIDAVYFQTSIVILFDNGSKNISQVETLISKYPNLLLIKSYDNIGVATALNQIAQYCYKKEYDWLLALDQDSVCPSNIINDFLKYVDIQDVAVICPRIEDKRQMYRYAFKTFPRSGFQEVQKCITAGSFIKLSVLKSLGWFNDFLFIDYVDYEYCRRIIANRYKIIQANSVVLNQELGNVVLSKHAYLYIKLGEALHSRIIMSFACKKTYSAMRRYYCARNHVYCIKKYRKYCNILDELFISIKLVIKMLFLSKQKIKVLIAMYRGFVDGMKLDVKRYNVNNHQ